MSKASEARFQPLHDVLCEAQVAFLSGVLVWAASFDRGYTLPEGALRRMLVYVGIRSYGIYVADVSVAMLFRYLLGQLIGNDPYHLFGLAIIAATFIVADLNYRFLEIRLRNYGRRVADRLEQRLAARNGASDAVAGQRVL